MADWPKVNQQILEVLRLLRVHHDMGRGDLAKEFEIMPGDISALESGPVSAGLDTLGRYSDYFNIPVSSIIYIAEQLPNERQGPEGVIRSCHCPRAAVILDIERAKARLKNDRKQ